MPAGEVERQDRGVRDVQARDGARHRQAGDHIAGFACQATQALALSAENKRDPIASNRSLDLAVGLAVETDAGEAHAADLFERSGEVLDFDPFDLVECAGSGLREDAGFCRGVAARARYRGRPGRRGTRRV